MMGDLDMPSQALAPVAIEGRSMAILYGSETGNAEEIAVELGKMAQRLHFQTTVDEMDGFKLADVLRYSLVVFVTSTTGQGDMPKNTRKFWKNLRREKLNNTNCLRSLSFTIFGLGDSAYSKFNWAARKLRARLLQLGASEFFRAGEGDERHDNGIDSIYLPWSKEFKEYIMINYPLPESVAPIPDDTQLPSKYPIRLLADMDINTPNNIAASDGPLTDDDQRWLATRTKSAARSHVDTPTPPEEQVMQDWERKSATFPAHIARQDDIWERTQKQSVDVLDHDNVLKDHPEKYLLKQQSAKKPRLPPSDMLPIPDSYEGFLIRNERVTPTDHWQDVRHLVLDVDLPHKLWDQASRAVGNLTVTIFPKNYPDDVDELIRLMDWQDVADRPLRIPYRPRNLVTKECPTLRDLLLHNLDITAIPKRNFIRELSFYASDEREKERLRELTLPGNEQEFYDYTCRPRRTILELLGDFRSVKIPWGAVLDLFPLIRGREFSVCNGGTSFETASEPNRIRLELLVALVEYKTIIRKPRQGLCSRYLKHLPTGTRLRVLLKAGSAISLVPNKESAKRPVIAIATGTGIAPIRAIIQERDSYPSPGDTLLFFGCRNRMADFHFEKEWEVKPNLRVFPAFSRDNIEPDPASTQSIAASSKTTIITNGTLPTLQLDAHKNYVQHLIRKHADLVGHFMRQRPIICVCGSAGNMPKAVRAALIDAMIISGVVSNCDEGDKMLRNHEMVTYWEETW